MNENAGQRPLLTYDGSVGELYGIFLKNLLLTIVTLGIYRFWATTQMRRYVWSRMRFQNERFEYTGTGGELFKGFLLALGMLIGGVIVTMILGIVLHLITHNKFVGFLPVIAFYVLLVVYAAGAFFSAQRYRLSRTVWCGIRGGMTGSMLAYGVQVLLYALATVVTLGQLAPWTTVRLAERRINASSFGSAPFRFQGRAGTLYVAFLLSFIGMAAWFAVIGWLFMRPMVMMIAADPGAFAHGAPMPPQFVVSVVAFYLLFIVGALLLRCWYIARVSQHILGNTTLGSYLRFGTTINGKRLLAIAASNLAIVVFTLGLGFPIALHRALRFIANTVTADGNVDPASLGQSDMPPPRTGEGALNLLDHGGAF